MSGIEVAGLVLGSIPLIISGLEHYGEGVHTIKSMWNYPQEFASLSRRMQVEQDIFHNAIELLLSGCVEDAVLTELLKNPGGDIWSDPVVDEALKEKMRRSYAVYLETVKGMQTTLDRFRERLKLGPDGKGPFHDRKSFKEAYKRFKFGLKKAAYIDLLEEISRDNASLTKLTEQSKTLEPVRSSRRRIPNFSQMRSHASSIFGTLQKSLQGSCQVAHRASVYVRDTNDHCSDLGEPSCRVVLHHAIHPTSAAKPLLWFVEETELRLVKVVVNASSNPPSQSSIGASTQPTRKSRVQFSTQSLEPTPAHSDLTNLEEIQDLCMSFARLRAIQGGQCLGYLVDATMDRHALYWPEKPLVDRKSLPVISLADVLTTRKQTSPLSGGDSRRLAAALAFGMLRLHDTPWLAKQWSHADITFFEKDGALLTEHPFISTDVEAQSTIQHAAATSMPNPMIRNETVFALGILLIELCMETSFYELQKNAGDLNPDGTKHVASDIVTANRMLDKVYAKFGARYGDAVRRCILCEFDQRRTSLEDDAFRQAVYDNVVAVLDEEVRQFFGQT